MFELKIFKIFTKLTYTCYFVSIYRVDIIYTKEVKAKIINKIILKIAEIIIDEKGRQH